MNHYTFVKLSISQPVMSTILDLLVFLSIVSQYQVLEGHFNSDPLLIAKRWPYMVGLSYRGLVRLEDDLCLLSVNMEGPQDENETRESLGREREGGGEKLRKIVKRYLTV